MDPLSGTNLTSTRAPLNQTCIAPGTIAKRGHTLGHLSSPLCWVTSSHGAGAWQRLRMEQDSRLYAAYGTASTKDTDHNDIAHRHVEANIPMEGHFCDDAKLRQKGGVS